MVRFANLLVVVTLAGCTSTSPDHPRTCTGKCDGPGSGAMTNFATSWELQIGQSGDAVLNRVVPLEDGSLLALSEVPSWVMKVDADGTLDTAETAHLRLR